MTIHRISQATFATLLVVSLAASGCASDEASDKGSSANKKVVPPITSTMEDGKLIKRFDVNDDGRAEIEKVFELVDRGGDADAGETTSSSDPEGKPANMKEVLREKRIDVNQDGTYDIVRYYDDARQIKRERVDIDRDGFDDWVSYFDQGNIARKEMLGDEGETITSTRYYDGEGELKRVEIDRNDDDKIDYWEYYESGNLTRIGRDVDGDEKADSWTRRRTKTATSGSTPEVAGQQDSESNDEGASDSNSQSSDSDSNGDDNDSNSQSGN